MKFTAAATVLVAAGGLLQSVGATVLVAKYRNCINGYDAIAPVNAQLNVTSVLASLVPGKEGDSLNLNAGGNDVLRLDLIGTLKQQLVEFNETSGKLGMYIHLRSAMAGLVNGKPSSKDDGLSSLLQRSAGLFKV